jgi:hypothetical protein
MLDAEDTSQRAAMSVRQQEASSNQEEVAKAIDALAIHQNNFAGEAGDGDSLAPSTLAKDVPPIKRTVLVSIRASMDDLVQESGAGRWAPSEGALKSICAPPPATRHCAQCSALTSRAPLAWQSSSAASRASTAPARRRATSARSCCTKWN